MKFNETDDETPKEDKMMKRTLRGNPALAIALIVLAAAAGLWPVPSASQTADAAPTADAAVDPAALAALDSMGVYLRTLKSFQVEVAIESEDVLDNGIKAQYAGVINIVARKPDRLRAEVSTDLQERQYFYDGKQFTLWAPRSKYYSTVPAPPTIGELVNVLQEKFEIEMPLVDIFRWGAEGTSGAGITAAVDLGPSTVGGTTCQHYAFRQEGLDWQVWIQKGDFALPRKLVLTTTTDEARPQYQATYTWNLAPSFNDAAFTFDPPGDARQIVFATISPEAGASK